MPVRRTRSQAAEYALDPRTLDSGWLRSLLRQALRCSLASSVALSACAASGHAAGGHAAGGHAADGGPGDVERPVSRRTQPIAECADSIWRLAPGFQLARKVDYTADRLNATPNGVVSEAGEPCATATDRATCEAALELPTPTLARHLVTTERDQVRLWSMPSALTLFGDIDTPEEAIWMLLASGYTVDCSAPLGFTLTGYTIDAKRATGQCAPATITTRVFVARDGSTQPALETVPMGASCATPGRRPEGLRSQHQPRGAALLGEHFAGMAHMEAASVPAFAAITRELQSYRAPAALVRGARRALRDEIRHAELSARLALRFGAEPSVPAVEPMPLRSLEAFALDNAVEGCVNETYAALEAAHQAARASDPSVRRALAIIAADEARHAELSFQIARWVTPRLDRAARARIRSAQRAAAAALGDKLGAQVQPELSVRAGVPDAGTARALHASLSRSLWRV